MQIVRDIRGLPAVVRMLLTTNAVSAFGGGLVMPFLWIYLTKAQGLAAWVPATVLTVQAIVAFVSAPIWGSVFDRRSPRVCIPAVMVVAAIGTALFGIATNPASAILAGVVYGVGISGVGTALRVMYGSQTRTDKERMTAFSIDFALLNAFSGLGVLVGGAVAAINVGTLANRLSILYVVDGATFLLTAAAAFKMIPSGPPSGGSRRPKGYARLLATPWFSVCISVLFLQLLATAAQLKSAFPAYLTAETGVSPTLLSLLFGVNVGVAVLTQFFVMPRLKSVSPRTLLQAAGLLAALSWVLLLAAGNLPARTVFAGAAMLTISFAESFCVPLLSTIINNRVGEGDRGRANASVGMAISASSALGPALTGLLIGVAHGTVLLIALGLCGLLSSVLVLSIPEVASSESGVELV
jgi:MFS family permease